MKTIISWRTGFVVDKRVRVNSVGKFVRFATDQNGNIVCFGHESNLRAAKFGHHVTIGQQCVCFDQYFGNLEEIKKREKMNNLRKESKSDLQATGCGQNLLTSFMTCAIALMKT